MSLRNLRFSLSEWTGAFGDLGTLLPLAYTLVIFNGFPPQRLFFLWGAVYVATGLVFRVPVSVQPLKAMAVIAIAAGFSVTQLASTAFFYGLLMLLLVATGAIRLLERWFTPAMVRGVQLGIGLILLHKALTLISGQGLYLGMDAGNFYLQAALAVAVLIVIAVWQLGRGKPVSLVIILGSVAISRAVGVSLGDEFVAGAAVAPQWPELDFFTSALFLLMIPQLPLTLGNAVFAACDACHQYWPQRSLGLKPSRFAASIGLSNLAIGLLGGFPICHGAGGIAAHARFGGKTGGTTVIAGILFMAVALLPDAADFLFYIPIPILGALLLVTSWGMISLMTRLSTRREWAVAGLVGVISLLTRNLTVALVAGFALEKLWGYVVSLFPVSEVSEND